MDKTFFEQQEDGTIVEINTETGEEVATSDKSSLLPLEPTKRVWTFSQKHADLLLQKIQSGRSLTKICKDPTMPSYQTLCRWRTASPKFDELIRVAIRQRAEFYRAKIEDSIIGEDGKLLKPVGKESTPGAKLQFEQLKFLAKVDDPETYSEKQNKEGSIKVVTQIVVDTGIHREPTTIITGEEDGQSTK